MSMYSPYNYANEAIVSNPRDASFSSYLDSSEREYIRNLSTSLHSPSPAREAPSPRAKIEGKNRISRSELGVFGADKYFNDSLEEKKSPSTTNRGARNKQKHRRSEGRYDQLEKRSTRSTSSITTTTASSNLKSPTPSLKSEGSFSSSQFSLLLPKKAINGLKILSGFQYKGTCFDKKSVYTTNTTQDVMQSPSSYQGNVHRKSRISHQEHFAFPIIDTASNYNQCEDPPRKSLEVFGFHHIGKQDIAHNLERKLSILAWDAIPNSKNASLSFPFPNSRTSMVSHIVGRADDQDARSDASSDLFEIDNLSGIPAKQTCCAPSEASIEWSVVTASAADFSVISHYRAHEKVDTTSEGSNKYITREKSKVHRTSSSSGGGLLMGCRSNKAVDVVGSFNHNHSNNYARKNIEKNKFDYKSSHIIAPSTPPRNFQSLAYV